MSWLHFRDPVSAWTHFAWMVLALPATWVLWWLGRGSLLKRTGSLIFGFTLVFCYAGSWLFHSVPDDLSRPFNTIDHIGIYLLIAGTVTPIGLVLLSGRWRLALLSGIWALAAAGILARLLVHPTIVQLTIFYLFMGWVGSLAYLELARRVPRAALRPLWIGGLCYTVGAVLNGLHWPVLVPGVFESHEVFHLFVMAGSGWHYYFMLSAVLPYQALAVEAAVSPQSRFDATRTPTPASSAPGVSE